MSRSYPGVAAVTGAASGIGRATCLAFANGGCSKLALLDCNVAGLEDTKALVSQIISSSQRSPDLIVIEVDVTSPEAVTHAYSSIRTHFSRIDYSVQCAGIGSPIIESISCSVEIFDRQTAVNYRGLWLCTREVIKIMQGQTLNTEAYPEANIPATRAQRGSIVNISSTLALYAQAFCAPYSGSKGGVLAVTRADAMDCVSHKIRVNAVLPGLIDTPMTMPNSEEREWFEKNVASRVPMRRLGQPEEIADLCVFLSGTGASYVTGQAWAADGGALGGYY
ncbi:uncharacterized protein A1O9_09170 [Exophiala aquamarina CBS 119918]|uniref:3-oxoacyl-[acyl-carrier protein] reductase n=1 Tax=Exophiala aquamarina CBS 119918 TaxID=1182545 RepID=A0A072P625_9EURO|nr:uncharacterized protein A1O9_09170 [Exophiala aquamarina CBS 119918]KEF54728.1 hypothetical protein A1O9_09170 [Exophiala aquamarina CBS 119918]